MKRPLQVRLSPTPEQATLLRAHCQEYISAINVLVAALDSDVLPNAGGETSTKDFTATLPSAVKHQARRDARSVWKHAFARGVIPVQRKPICQWNNQNWRLEGTTLLVPLVRDGDLQQSALRCAEVPLDGTPGVLRSTRKRDKWIADSARTVPEPGPTTGKAIMGVDLGIQVPAVVHSSGNGSRFFGNGREQRFKRRQFYGQRRSLQLAGKGRTLKQRQGQERRWMRATKQQRARPIVTPAQQQGVGVIRLERRAGIRQRTTRTGRGAARSKARKHNRMKHTWPCFQLAQLITYQAERLGIRVEQVAPSSTRHTGPACFEQHQAEDRQYVCAECGWHGQRAGVGAINIARDTGRRGHTWSSRRCHQSDWR